MSRNAYKLRSFDRELLGRFARERGGTVFIEVPVVGLHPPWDDARSKTLVDSVWFPTAASNEVFDWEAHQDAFMHLAPVQAATLVSARGYLDRTAFGVLLVGRMLYAQTFGVPMPRCLALSTQRYPNVERVYAEHGIEYASSSDAINRESVRASQGGANEDALLLTHYAQHYRGRGTLLTEARVPPWRVDGLWHENGHMTIHAAATLPEAGAVDLIEVKPDLNTDVIGQAVAGGDAAATPRSATRRGAARRRSRLCGQQPRCGGPASDLTSISTPTPWSADSPRTT